MLKGIRLSATVKALVPQEETETNGIASPGKLRVPQLSLRRKVKSCSLASLAGLLCLNIASCSTITNAPPRNPEIQLTALEQRLKEEHEAERSKWLSEKEAQQQEIERLQKLVMERDAYIRNQQARQQDQAKTLQETSTQAAQAHNKLRRLATRPAAASAIAETEIFMESLKSFSMTNAEESLQSQAGRLLGAATAAYAEDNYAAAMDHAAQARELVEMLKNNRARKSDHIPVLFQTPVPVRAMVNANLRQGPGLRSAVLGILKKDSAMTAEAYQRDWFKVQTADGVSGWVFQPLVEVYSGKP